MIGAGPGVLFGAIVERFRGTGTPLFHIPLCYFACNVRPHGRTAPARVASPEPCGPYTIPKPIKVSAKKTPRAVNRPPQDPGANDTSASGEALYSLIFDGRSEQFGEDNEPETILRVLIRRGIAVQEAWPPIASSVKADCMAPNVYLALIVQLEKPDPRIMDVDFTATSGRVYPNRGIEAFQHYDFG